MGAKPILTASALAMGFGVLMAGTPLAGLTGSLAAAAAEGQPKATQNDGSRRICRYLTPSGSRLTRRVCRTQAEWEASADRTQEGVLEFQRENTTQYEHAPGPR